MNWFDIMNLGIVGAFLFTIVVPIMVYIGALKFGDKLFRKLLNK